MVLITQRMGAAFGIMGPVAFMVLYIVAMILDDEYVFFQDYLSNLGVGDGAWAFNSAVILAGALGIPFILFGIWPRLDGGGVVAMLAVLVTVVAAVFLMLVGVFTEDVAHLHSIVTLGFFASIEVALGLFSWTLQRTNALGTPSTRVTQAAFIVGLAMVFLGFTPQTETVVVLMIAVWLISMAGLMFTNETGTPTN